MSLIPQSSNAKEIRDAEIGRDLFLTAHVHMITSCKLDPACKYCSLSSSLDEVRNERDALTMEELIKNVRFVSKRKEITSITLVGGSDLHGQDELVLNIVHEIRKITPIELALDIGAPISVETLKALKEENVQTIYASMESSNEKVFSDAKPGDSFEERQKLLLDVDKLGMNVGTVIMNGLGTRLDVENSVQYLRRLHNLRYLYFSTFFPVAGTPWESRKKASIAESLCFIQTSRILFPKANIGLADVEVETGSISDLIVDELEVGGGNTMVGMLIYRNRMVDYIKNMLSLEKLGYHVVTRKEHNN